MTFDDWWGAYPTQEDYEANCRDAWEASAASRDAEIAQAFEDGRVAEREECEWLSRQMYLYSGVDIAEAIRARGNTK